MDAQNTEHRVRLAGIDAPEKEQAFGNVSKRHLAGLVFDQKVTVEYNKLDRYRRIVGKVLVDGVDVNLEQVKAGLAWHYKKYENEQHADDRLAYAKAEQDARAKALGLWSDSAPVAPWSFRAGVRIRNPVGDDNRRREHGRAAVGF